MNETGHEGAGARKASPSGITRRTLIAGGAGAAVLLAVGGAERAFAQGTTLLRPPGAQDQDRLWALCIRCDRCRSACPHGAIGVAHIEDGLINARVPIMDFSKGFCDFCDGRYLCAENCPTQAISFGFDPERDKIGIARVDERECLLYRSNSHACSKQCIDACRYDALAFDAQSGELVVDEARCNGCGECEHACPSASYATYTASGRRGVNVETQGEEAIS